MATTVLLCGAACGEDFTEGSPGTGGSGASAEGGGGDGGSAEAGAGGTAGAGGELQGGAGGNHGSGGHGGSSTCFSCKDAVLNSTIVAAGDVCDDERSAYGAFHDCICEVIAQSNCGSCQSFCSNHSGASPICLSCVDDLDSCDDEGLACALPNF